MKIFAIAEQLEPITSVKSDTSLEETMKQIASGNGFFAVVDNAHRPQALLRDKYLSKLRGDQHRKLGELLSKFPALLTVDAEVGLLETEDLEAFAQLLETTKAPGIAVLQNNQAIGVISHGSIDRALWSSRALWPSPEHVRGSGDGGELFSNACSYICRKCPVPYPRRRPRQCDIAPPCPRNLAHGDMEPENI